MELMTPQPKKPGGAAVGPHEAAAQATLFGTQKKPAASSRIERIRARRRARRIRIAALCVLALAGVLAYFTGLYGASLSLLGDVYDSVSIALTPGPGFPTGFSLSGFVTAKPFAGGFVAVGDKDVAIVAANGNEVDVYKRQMMGLVRALDALQHGHRIVDGGFLHFDRLEAALQRLILLDIFAVLAEGGSADHLDLAPGPVSYTHLAAFDAAHIQNIVDEGEQKTRGDANFGDAVHHQFVVADGLGGDGAHANDGVHGRADLMAHAGKKIRLGRVGLLLSLIHI